MSDPDSNHCHNDGQEAIGKDTKGCRRKLAIGHSVGRLKSRGHDEFLHISPSQVGDLETDKATTEFEGLGMKVWLTIVGRALNGKGSALLVVTPEGKFA